ncbi:MAG: hypothetical protein IKY53_07770, partial [Lachnospiraceae bacterium]|nr:hypothetical protein [Lachnospiraceae bacterium]
IYYENYQKIYFPNSQAKKFSKAYIPNDGYDKNCEFITITHNDKRYSVLSGYMQPNGEITRKRLCPNCHNEIKNIGLNGRNKVISVLGYTQVGKTHYITSLLDYLCNVAPQVGPRDLSCTFISGYSVFDNNRVRYRSGPLRATDVQYIEPIIIDLSFDNSGKKEEVFISFYDFPGEATNAFLGRAMGKHVACADAYMLLFDMTKTKTFWADSKGQDLRQVEAEFEKILSDASVISHIKADVKNKLKSYINGSIPINDKVFGNRRIAKSFDVGLMSLEDKEGFLVRLEDYASECVVDSLWNYFRSLISSHSAVVDENIKNNPPAASATDLSSFLADEDTKKREAVSEKSKSVGPKSEFIAREKFVSEVMSFAGSCPEMTQDIRNQKINEFYVFAQALWETEKENINLIFNNRENTEKRLGRLQVENEPHNLNANIEYKKGQNVLQTYKLFEIWIAEVFFGGAAHTVAKPTAVVGTKSDAIVSVLEEKYKVEPDDQLKKLYKNSIDIMSRISAPPSNSYYDAQKIESMNLCLSQLLFDRGKDLSLNAFMQNFNKKSYFAVSSLGTKHVTDIYGEVTPEAHVNPRWVAEPLFWLLHQLGVIE